MGNLRLKLARGLGSFAPLTVNFSELDKARGENDEPGSSLYEAGDNGFESERINDTLEYEEMIVQILCNLEQREKLVFIYQLLRDGGFQIDHSAFAQTIHISRRQYMRILDDVRLKSALFIVGYKNAGHAGQVTKRLAKP